MVDPDCQHRCTCRTSRAHNTGAPQFVERKEGLSALETGFGRSSQKIMHLHCREMCSLVSQRGELCLGLLAHSSTQLSKIQMEVSPQQLWKTRLPISGASPLSCCLVGLDWFIRKSLPLENLCKLQFLPIYCTTFYATFPSPPPSHFGGASFKHQHVTFLVVAIFHVV